MSAEAKTVETKLRLKGSVQGDKKYPCSVCQKWPMLVPIYQCEEGHLICNPCSSNWYCKICNKKPVAKIRSVAVEHLQPELTKCDQDGCDGIFAAETDMKTHIETECNFTEVSLCKVLELDDENCRFKCKPGKVADAVKHMKEAHGAVGSQGKSAFDHRWLVPVPARMVESGLWFIAADEAVFVVKVFEKDERNWISIVSLGNRVELPNWKSTIILNTRVPGELSTDLTTYKRPLESVTDQNAGFYKARHKLDAGSSLMLLGKLEIDFEFKEFGKDVPTKAVLQLGQDVPAPLIDFSGVPYDSSTLNPFASVQPEMPSDVYSPTIISPFQALLNRKSRPRRNI